MTFDFVTIGSFFKSLTNRSRSTRPETNGIFSAIIYYFRPSVMVRNQRHRRPARNVANHSADLSEQSNMNRNVRSRTPVYTVRANSSAATISKSIRANAKTVLPPRRAALPRPPRRAAMPRPPTVTSRRQPDQ